MDLKDILTLTADTVSALLLKASQASHSQSFHKDSLLQNGSDTYPRIHSHFQFNSTQNWEEKTPSHWESV